MTTGTVRREGWIPMIQAPTVVLAFALVSATPVWAGKLTCLTGTAPIVANDLAQIAAVRAVVEAACPCGDYDGVLRTQALYAICTKRAIDAEVGAGHLRSQCKGTAKKYYSTSTCGVPAYKGVVPCIKTTVGGRVSCSIKRACLNSPGYTRSACFGFSNCIDAADTNHDGIVGAGDSGACPYNFVDNGDGTITETQVGGLMWEKKDQAGGLHDLNTLYIWAGLCGCTPGSCTGNEPLCQPNASAANACSAATGGALGCAQCSSGTCNVDVSTYFPPTTTIWDWLVQLNESNFAGHNDWRLPTIGHNGGTVELETVAASLFDMDCTPGCVVTACSCTGHGYWSATSYVPCSEDLGSCSDPLAKFCLGGVPFVRPCGPQDAWEAAAASVNYRFKGEFFQVRAVRGGL